MEIESIEEVADMEKAPSKTNEEGIRERKKSSDKEDESAKKLVSVEEIFEGVQVPSWKKQLTFRALVVGAALGVLMSVIVMKLNLTTGVIPSLNISAGLLGFFLIKSWTKVIESCGLLKQPFTRQENTVIQTCVVACADIAFSGGFGSYLLGMSKVVADQSKGEKYVQVNTKEPSLAWIIPFLFSVSFVGLFSIAPLRKIMILGYRLTYPSGTATAHLINSFHTPHGGKIAMKQVYMLLKTLVFSFLWDFFQWFFTGGDGCGFASFPTFGLKAYENSFYFDFSATYVGVGMICPYIINFSLFLGSVISWGILWPYIAGKKGIWYDENATGMRGLQGYKVFISIAIILGDGLFQFLLVMLRTAYDIRANRKKKENAIPLTDQPSLDGSLETQSFDDHRRTKAFLQDQIPSKVAIGGYVLLALISVLAVPKIFPELKFYHIIVIYLMAPVLAFCNTYGAGLTDWSLASSYGKLAIFIFGAWIGAPHGGLLASLAACGVMMSIVSTASDLMQDFKTGYLTLSSPMSMFISQVIGTAMGCVIGPSVFWLFYKAFPLGTPNSQYPAPYAAIYRSIGSLATEGLAALPQHCGQLCFAFFLGAFGFNLVKEIARCNKWKVHKFIPSAMGMAIPFYIGSYFTIDMCIGSLIMFVWEWRNKKHADIYVAPFASGLICGEGLWSLPASLLAMFKVNPPLCMMVLSRADTAKLATVLGS